MQHHLCVTLNEDAEVHSTFVMSLVYVQQTEQHKKPVDMYSHLSWPIPSQFLDILR